MFQIDNSTAATQLPTISNPGTPGFFTDGNPATGQAPTIVPAEWFNTVMMELCNAVIASGQTLTKGKLNQLALAIQSQGAPFAIDTGTANTYVVNFTPAFTSRTEGQVIRFKAKTANNGASTLNDGIGAVPFVGGAHSALQGGEIVANGDCWAQWNSSVGGLGSYVLLFCTGAPEQVANATQSKHAVNLGQADGRYATITNPSFNGPTNSQITEGGSSIYQLVSRFMGTGISGISNPGGYSLYYKSGVGSSNKSGELLSVRSLDTITGESPDLLTLGGDGALTLGIAPSFPAGTLPGNPVINSSVATSSTDPSGSLNTANPASTSWVRNAMSSIATAAGFATSLGANGYIKFPTWLGGFVIQWGALSVTTTVTNYNFPTAFPNGCLVVVGSPTPNSLQTMGFSPISKTQFSAATTQYNPGAYYIAFGY